MAGHQRKSYVDLKIAGTHNSAITKRDLNTGNAIQSEFKKFGLLSKIASSFFSGWITCQQLSILEQLEAGVRYLDLRLSRIKGVFHVTHSYEGPSLVSVLDQIVEFYEKHGTSEVVVVALKPDHQNKSTMVNAGRPLSELIGKHPIGKYRNNGRINRLLTQPLEDFGSKPLVFMYHNIEGLPNEHFFAPWFNASTESQLFRGLKGGFDTVENIRGNISVLQAILTPSQDQIIHSALLYVYFIVLVLFCLPTILLICLLHSKHFTSLLKLQSARGVGILFYFTVVLAIVFSSLILYWRPAWSLRTLSKGVLSKFLEASEERRYNIVTVDFITEGFTEDVWLANAQGNRRSGKEHDQFYWLQNPSRA